MVLVVSDGLAGYTLRNQLGLIMYKAVFLFVLVILPTSLYADDKMDRVQLLEMHKQVLDAHKNHGLEKWLNGFTDDYVSANRGEISYPTPSEQRNRFRPYINSTSFEYYRDMVPPVVRVSMDGTLGWVIAQVEAKGQSGDDLYQFQSAWIELYEKKNGEWVGIGNVSNMKRN